MSDTRSFPQDNRLLASLPADLAEQVMPCVEAVTLQAGETLYEAGAALRSVYFPVDSVVSLVSPMQDGACAEVAVVGREGVAGVCAFMGGTQALSRAVVQRPGLAWRIPARDVARLVHDMPLLMPPLLRYTQALFIHMAQTSACHRHHPLGQKLCCWLLHHLDRQAGAELEVTQERVAGLLGVRREGVTGAALQLQRAGLIRYRRGHIHVLDREGLERQSCECYGVVEQAYARLRADADLAMARHHTHNTSSYAAMSLGARTARHAGP